MTAPTENADLIARLRVQADAIETEPLRLIEVTEAARQMREAADALEAKPPVAPTQKQIADQIMLKAIYGSREGEVITSEDRDDGEYLNALDAARAVLALLEQTANLNIHAQPVQPYRLTKERK